MTTLVYDHPTKGTITYTDKKRNWWLLSLYFPLVPIVTIWAYYMIGNPWVLVSPIIINYTVIPFLDWALGTDESNPPEEIVPQLDEDKYYEWLTYGAIPMHFIALGYGLWFIAN